MTSPAHAPPVFSPLFSFQQSSATADSPHADESASQSPDTPFSASSSAPAPPSTTTVGVESDLTTSPSHPTDENAPSDLRSLPALHTHGHDAHFPVNFNKNRRTSVSGESLSPGTFSNGWRPRTVVKTPEQNARLNRIIAQNFLFRGLDAEALQTILNVLEEKRIAANVTIIQQGDEGEKFYVIESGTVDYYINGDKVSSSGPGSSFGELALMYNSPRAATVMSTSPCVLWVLDGTTFRRILMERTASKRAMYEHFLREVPVLTSLTDWERAKIADALKALEFGAGDVIIKEGDVGEHFYLIEDGEAEVYKEGEGKVTELGKGDYFGELALLNDAPRAATVVAKTNVNVVTLDKSGFKRMLGEVILKQK
ncbi:cyclic nucleotide-binding-like protein [Lipomyces orientalis]|uniref:Cyclic nucleotide-binding-like protein n=1 Tax=Lipomyces orientalis TaxID=1233043 RepID=A0ACC3TQ18_9ASCO